MKNNMLRKWDALLLIPQDWYSLHFPHFASPIEKNMWLEFTRLGLVPRTQQRAGPYKIDLVLKFPALSKHDSRQRVVVECDGKNFHHGLVDDFRDDMVYSELGLPVCHVAGNHAQYMAPWVALKIGDMFFGELRQTGPGLAQANVFLDYLKQASARIEVLNALLRRAGYPVYGSSELAAKMNGRLAPGCKVTPEAVVEVLFRAGCIHPFTLSEYSEGWVSPWQSSPYSTLENRAALRAALGPDARSMRPYQLAVEYARRFYSGTRRSETLVELASYSKKRRESH